MIDNLNYEETGQVGATWGVIRYREDSGIPCSDLAISFVYGLGREQLDDNVARLKSRIDYCAEFPNETIYLDGFSAISREIIVHMRVDEQYSPAKLVKVEIHPPFEDPQVQARHEAGLQLYMELAAAVDSREIGHKLSVFGLRKHISRHQ